MKGTPHEDTLLAGARWRKSSLSDSTGKDCVEVAFLDDTVALRDSKNPTGPKLYFTPYEWTAFLGGVKNGEFDPA
jgi:hypothetical protein